MGVRMFYPASIIGFVVAMLYVMFAQQSFAGAPIDWGGIAWSAVKVFAFIFGTIVLFTAPFRSRR